MTRRARNVYVVGRLLAISASVLVGRAISKIQATALYRPPAVNCFTWLSVHELQGFCIVTGEGILLVATTLSANVLTVCARPYTYDL